MTSPKSSSGVFIMPYDLKGWHDMCIKQTAFLKEENTFLNLSITCFNFLSQKWEKDFNQIEIPYTIYDK